MLTRNIIDDNVKKRRYDKNKADDLIDNIKLLLVIHFNYF